MMGETEAVEIDDILDDWFIESLKSWENFYSSSNGRFLSVSAASDGMSSSKSP